MISENHLEFLRAVWTRRTPFTFIFLAINIAIFLLMSLAGGTTNGPTLMAFGVKSNAEIHAGQWWRLITPIFIHIGLIHLFFNSYALWIVGPQVEKLYGSARFVILYVLTGVAGVLGSYFFHPENVSAGASGAIFGLFGVLLTFGIRYRHSIPPFFKKAVGTGVLPVIAINLFIGFTIRGIDNSAHISGLIAGAVLAAVIPYQQPGGSSHPFFTAAQILLLTVVAVCFVEVGLHYDGPRLSFPNIAREVRIIGGRSAADEFIDAINNAQKTFETSSQELEAGNTSAAAKLRSILTASIDQLQKTPSLASRPDELMAELLRVLQDQYDLIQDVERAGTVTFAHSQRLKANAERYNRVMDSFFKWVETDGEKYGIVMTKGR